MKKSQVLELSNDSIFGKNLWNYTVFASWVNWYPDLFLDLITPKKGGIRLNADQRILLRCILRFVSIYGVFPRGYGKTFIEVLAAVIVAIRFPDITIALTAQTKENAAELLTDKVEEIFKYYPMLKNEMSYAKSSKGDAEYGFKSGGVIDILANAQSSKGQRRKRMNIEESALLNDALFQDALKPIVEVPRYTIGKYSVANPEELNQQINFFTTAGFRGSDEYQRSVTMYKNMINLSGEIVIGSGWMLPCWYQRGSSKSQILQKKKEMSPIAFDQNYASKWVGSSDNAFVDINHLMECRSLLIPQLEAKNIDEEFYLGVDVARSQNKANNQSAVSVVKVNRNKNTGKIISEDLVNIVKIPNILNFTAQAIRVKKIQKAYHAQMVICDGNGLGAGLIDELLKSQIDPITNETYEAWDTINTTNESESPYAPKLVYDLKAQSAQSKIVTNFIDLVDSKRLRLLVKKQDSEYTERDRNDYESKIAPYDQTDALFEEIANLKIKHLGNGGLTLERVVRKLDKDRVSATIYVLWYINEFCREIGGTEYEYDFSDEEY